MKRKPPENNVRNTKTNGFTIHGCLVSQAGETVQFESYKEHPLLIGFLRDPSIKRIISQPVEIEFRTPDGKKHTYVPDFKVIRVDGTIEIHEFSMLTKQRDNNIQARHEAGIRYCEENGMTFFLHDEFDLPSETEQRNISVFRVYRADCYANKSVVEAAYCLLDATPEMYFQTLEHQIVDKLTISFSDVSKSLLHMLWTSELKTDLNKPMFSNAAVNKNVKVWLPK